MHSLIIRPIYKSISVLHQALQSPVLGLYNIPPVFVFPTPPKSFQEAEGYP